MIHLHLHFGPACRRGCLMPLMQGCQDQFQQYAMLTSTTRAHSRTMRASSPMFGLIDAVTNTFIRLSGGLLRTCRKSAETTLQQHSQQSLRAACDQTSGAAANTRHLHELGKGHTSACISKRGACPYQASWQHTLRALPVDPAAQPSSQWCMHSLTDAFHLEPYT